MENKDNRINWMGSEKQIVAFFLMLEEKGLIKDFSDSQGNKQWGMIEAHFLNKQSEPFKPRQLASVFQQIKAKKN